MKMGVDIGFGQRQDGFIVKIEERQSKPRNIMGIERGKRNSYDFIILTKAACLVNNNTQEKSRFSTKVLYVDKIH